MHHITDWIAHTTAFVIPVVEHWKAQWKEGNVLFNDAINTFMYGYVVYGKRSPRKKGNPMHPLHELYIAS